MGREIRYVPPGWEHPIVDCPHTPRCDYAHLGRGRCYRPLYDRVWREDMDIWMNGLSDWLAGAFTGQPANAERSAQGYAEWVGAPPDPRNHRPKWTIPPTWIQMYETISEGTPLTPPFPCAEQLIEYLTMHGDYWDQCRGDPPWPRDRAQRFAADGWAPTAILRRGDAGELVVETPSGLELRREDLEDEDDE